MSRQPAAQDTFESNLPVYEAKQSRDFPEFLIVFCPREDCIGTRHGRPFLVHKRTWLRSERLVHERTGRAYQIVGRSCPYCFRTSRIPRRGEIEPA